MNYSHPALKVSRVMARKVLAAGIGAARMFRSDRRGSVAMSAAIAFPVVIGGAGLGTEVSYWYLTERKLQHAADVAAYAAALRLKAGEEDQTTLDAAALHVAVDSGFTDQTGNVLDVIYPWVDGDDVAHDDKVKVVLTESLDPLFTKFFGRSATEVEASAVAQVNPGIACVLALSPTANSALHASSSANVSFENCVVATNSSSASAFHMQGATLNVDCVYSHGGYQETGNSNNLTLNDCDAVETDIDRVGDPYADVVPPSKNAGASCTDLTVDGGPLTTSGIHTGSGLPYRCFRDLTLKGNVTVADGLYIIERDLTINANANITSSGGGNGVTFVIYRDIKWNGGAHVTLSAPTAATNPYKGLLFFGDRDTAAETIKINGDSSSNMQGAIYFPTGNLTFTGSSGTTAGCTQVIANTISFTGNSGFHSDCDDAGTKEIESGRASVALFQ